MDIKQRYKECHAIERTCEALLERLEGGGGGEGHQLQVEVSKSLNELSRLTENLDADIARGGNQVEQVWKYKVQQLQGRCKLLRDALGTCLTRQSLMMREREELLARRRHDREAATEHEILLDHAAMRKESLNQSHSLADNILDNGRSVLEALHIQNESLHRISAGLLDMRGTMEMSTQLMRTIERRVKQDKWIVYGSMLGIVALMVLLYIYL